MTNKKILSTFNDVKTCKHRRHLQEPLLIPHDVLLVDVEDVDVVVILKHKINEGVDGTDFVERHLFVLGPHEVGTEDDGEV